jgi:hypothetical protein
MRDIRIRPILNGWLVKVGCQEICITDAETLGKEITRYVQRPGEVEKEYLSKALNKNITNNQVEMDRPEMARMAPEPVNREETQCVGLPDCEQTRLR